MPHNNPIILAIDTSCDETSIAVTQGQKILRNAIASQIELHKQYGGDIQTVAKQAHKDNIEPTIKAALKKAKIKLSELTAIAVTQGPGLAPALEIGITKAKELGQQLKIPVLPINHIEGHSISVLAQPTPKNKNFKPINPQFPVLSIIVSGGHTEFILINKIGSYQKLGFTLDDAAGECLDKVGRLLGLGYPAGSVVEKLAKKGNAKAFPFPLPMTTSNDFNLSFSGIKTHSKNAIKKLETEKKLNPKTIADFCASLQFGVFKHLTYKLKKLLTKIEIKEIWLGGGVAANVLLRANLRKIAQKKQIKFRAPYSKKLTGDNAAMIGVAAHYLYLRSSKKELETLKKTPIDRKPHWSIENNSI